jgi:hypothetical protein
MYLDEILKPLLSGNKHILADTFDFINKVSKFDLAEDKYLVSFDFESLFANISTEETIEIILKRAFNKKGELFHCLSRKDLRKLLVICTQQSHFQFNGELGLGLGFRVRVLPK